MALLGPDLQLQVSDRLRWFSLDLTKARFEPVNGVHRNIGKDEPRRGLPPSAVDVLLTSLVSMSVEEGVYDGAQVLTHSLHRGVTGTFY